MSSDLHAAIKEAHDLAQLSGNDGYFDPQTGLFVLTGQYLRTRGTCCDSGCRHCPYRDDQESDDTTNA